MYNALSAIMFVMVSDVNREHIPEELAEVLGQSANFIQDMVGAKGSDIMPYVFNNKEEMEEYDAESKRSTH
jgi:hypothetical protein